MLLLPSIGFRLSAQDLQPNRFSETIEVRLVEVEVTVRTRRGEPVHGLSRDVFRLIVDGREVPIEHFTEIATGAGSGAQEAHVPRAEFGDSALDSAVPVNVLIYIDEEFSLEIDLERVLAALERQLMALEPRDRIAIVAWDGRHLERILDWKAPGDEVRAALAAARERPAWGLRTRLDESGWRADLLSGTDASARLARLESPLPAPICSETRIGAERPCISAERAMSRVRILEVDHRVDRTARAVAAAVRSFAPPDGRRVLALLSGGWASNTMNKGGMLGAWDPLLDITDQLRYSIYAVDVPGMSAIFLADVENSGLNGSSGGAGFSTVPMVPVNNEGPIHYTLRYLAERTGGEALINWERRHVFRLISEEARAYYSLGFTTGRHYDDASHSIQVEVLRRGLKVRNRRSFRDLSTSAELDYALEAALLGGASQEVGEKLSASLGVTRRAGVRRIRVPLHISIAGEPSSAAEAQASALSQVLELRIAAVDDEGRRTLVGPVPIALPMKRPDGGALSLTIPLQLRRTSHELAVSLHDPSDGSLRTAHLRLDP